MHTHRWEVAGKCSCGSLDDIQHRISGCHRARGSDLEEFWANMKKAQNIPDPRPVKEEGFICFINGERVAAKDFSWDKNLPIFTYGSVAFPRWTRLSAGAGAAVQIPDHSPLEENKMVRSVTLQIPAGWPQTVVISQHLALPVTVFACNVSEPKRSHVELSSAPVLHGF